MNKITITFVLLCFTWIFTACEKKKAESASEELLGKIEVLYYSKNNEWKSIAILQKIDRAELYFTDENFADSVSVHFCIEDQKEVQKKINENTGSIIKIRFGDDDVLIGRLVGKIKNGAVVGNSAKSANIKIIQGIIDKYTLNGVKFVKLDTGKTQKEYTLEEAMKSIRGELQDVKE